MDFNIKDIEFQVNKYDVYNNYYLGIKTIVPENRMGFLVGALPDDMSHDIDELYKLYPDHYIFIYNSEYDICLQIHKNRSTIREYIEEHDINHIFYPGDIVSWNEYIFPVRKEIVIPDINKIKNDIQSLIRRYMSPNDNLLNIFPHGYIDTLTSDIIICGRLCTPLDYPEEDVLFPVYIHQFYGYSGITYIRIVEGIRDMKDTIYKQYVRCRRIPISCDEYKFVGTIFPSRPHGYDDIDISV